MDNHLKRFIVKLGIFSLVFILISLLLGSWMVDNKVLWKDYYFIVYGGLGYLVLFFVITFFLMIRDKLNDLKQGKFSLFFVFLSILSLIAFYLSVLFITKVDFNIVFFLIHLIFLSIFFFLALGIFGSDFFVEFIKKFRKEIIICFIFAVLFYIVMFFVWRLWPFFSFLVSRIVYFLLGLTFTHVMLIEPRTLSVSGFNALIGEPCSGVYSMFLFTCLYLFIFFLDYKKLNRKKMLLMFIPSIIGLFLVNVIRIYLLMLVGVFISPYFARTMFHSYIGSILFMVYFIVFWLIFYKWMRR